MRWTRHNLPKSPHDLDRFVRDHGLRPTEKIKYKEHYIYLAETEHEVDLLTKPEYPFGFYQAAWFVSSPTNLEKFDVGSWGEYDALHDAEKGWTLETKRLARLEDVLQIAKDWIDKSEEVGRYAIH